MSRDFIGSAAGRSFKRSPNRDRVTRGPQLIGGFKRRMSTQTGVSVLIFEDYPAIPTPPPSNELIQRRNTPLQVPANYDKILLIPFGGANETFGTVNNLPIQGWPAGTAFKMVIRAWGVACLINPGEPQQTPGNFLVPIYDVPPRFWLSNQNFKLNGFPQEIGIPLNAITIDPESELVGNTFDLYELDRRITIYGTVTNNAVSAWSIITPFDTRTTPKWVNSVWNNGQNFGLGWHEPNYTLDNPNTPADVIATAGLSAEELARAQKLYYHDGQFSDFWTYARIGMCARIDSFESAQSTPPELRVNSMVDITQRKISGLRSQR